MAATITFKAGDTILVGNFSTFRLESDMENYGHVAFAHARKLNRATGEWGPVIDRTFQPCGPEDIKLIGADVISKMEAA